VKTKPKKAKAKEVRNPGSPWRAFAPKRVEPEPLPVRVITEVDRAVMFMQAEARELGD